VVDPFLVPLIIKNPFLFSTTKNNDDISSLLQTKALFKVKVGICANKRTTSDGESKVFKRYLVSQAKTTKEGKNKYFGLEFVQAKNRFARAKVGAWIGKNSMENSRMRRRVRVREGLILESQKLSGKFAQANQKS
jgi:hypothetical protein